MELPRYEIENSVGSKYFEFVSSGTNGNIVKVVKYVPFPNQKGYLILDLVIRIMNQEN